jgi:asparagine synthase (glutamine-hydrolysing)
MCGFAGIFQYGDLSSSKIAEIAVNMGDTIRHRGPDDFGVWSDDNAQITLVHRRLSIVDLSVAGRQPMVSASGRYVIAFNGEIYNHLEIRNELQAVGVPAAWRGHSDTETLLASIEAWGLHKSLVKATGMFAFALWDRHERVLHLARDRIGEKPLYYGWQNGVFLFGSELKALKMHPAFNGQIDRASISLQMMYSYIPAPYSIYVGIKKLLPGCTISIREIGESLCEPIEYWSLHDVIALEKENTLRVNDDDAISGLERLLSSVISKQAIADVPLGAFLSGGIDSSLITSMMQAQSSAPVKTFTIGFDEGGYNEANYAMAVARHLGTEHTELYVSGEQALDVIAKLPDIYDEPFSDSSQIPTYLVSKMTSRHVTVALSGDGGDELFGGYNRYLGTERWWKLTRRIPFHLRHLVSTSLRSIHASQWDRLGSIIALLSSKKNWNNLANNVAKLAGVLAVDDSARLYQHFTTHWTDPSLLVINDADFSVQSEELAIQLDSIVEEMMALDTLSYLPDDILVKVDRAAMAASLETRVPFLDHNVIEFAWSLPLEMKIRNGQGKWILRELLKKYIPNEMIDRPKMGFGIPLDSWLRGPLRPWAEELLDESRLQREGIFKTEVIRRKWLEHLSGRCNWQFHLWDVLMFQLWLESQ